MYCWQFLTSSCFRALLHLRLFLWVIPFLTQMQMFVIVQRPRCQDGSFTLEPICGGCFFMHKGRIIRQMKPNFLYHLTKSHVHMNTWSQIMHRQIWFNIGPGFYKLSRVFHILSIVLLRESLWLPSMSGSHRQLPRQAWKSEISAHFSFWLIWNDLTMISSNSSAVFVFSRPGQCVRL